MRLVVAREPHTAEERSRASRLKPAGPNAGGQLKLAPGASGGSLQLSRMEDAMADYATLLRDHVTLKCGSIDRIFMQAYVPKLQSVGQVCIFLHWQRGFKIPSSAAFGKIGDEYVKGIHQYADE